MQATVLKEKITLPSMGQEYCRTNQREEETRRVSGSFLHGQKSQDLVIRNENFKSDPFSHFGPSITYV